MRFTRCAAILLTLALAVSACSKPTAEEPTTTTDDATSSGAIVKTAGEAIAVPRTPSPAGARVFFITPADGDTVSNPVSIQFGIDGMQVAKAGDQQPNSGHHHLLIDTDLPSLELPIPASENHVHFGDGSTSAQINLEPGTHTLRMLLGDHLHIPHNPPVASDPITIVVE